ALRHLPCTGPASARPRRGWCSATARAACWARSHFVNTVWVPSTKRAGVPYRKFHTIRHTHISKLLADGLSVVKVARRVGDRPEVIHKVYAHYVRASGDRITTKLDELYG